MLDAAQSLKTFHRGKELWWEEFAHHVHEHSLWKSRSNYELLFDNLMSRPKVEIKNIGIVLGIELTPAATEEIKVKLDQLKNIVVPYQTIDEETRMCPRHISKEKISLTKSEIDSIKLKCRKWFERYGK